LTRYLTIVHTRSIRDQWSLWDLDVANGERTIAVTGASAGIGVAIAVEAAKLGWNVAIGARRRDRLAELGATLTNLGASQVAFEALDVRQPESVDAFFAAAEARLGLVDVIVNNAGMSIPSRFHEYPVEQIRAEVETNLLGSLFVTRRALSQLVQSRKRGDIVFMSSDAVRRPRPRQVVYGATKAALENFSDGLAQELEGSGIRVTKIRVGPTLTEFGSSWSLERAAEQFEYWRGFGLRDARLLGALLPAEAVARAVILAVTQPPGTWLDTVEIQPEAPIPDE
jgi:NADP-dependent 3-hydroxy acid dehydrogenase YdfG